MKGKWLFKKACILIGWLLIWQLLVLLVGNDILLAGPGETFLAAVSNMQEIVFWKTILFSILRIFSGFLLGLAFGVLLAALSERFPLIEEILQPVVTLIKAVPVASFVVLFLIWWRLHWVFMKYQAGRQSLILKSLYLIRVRFPF